MISVEARDPGHRRLAPTARELVLGERRTADRAFAILLGLLAALLLLGLAQPRLQMAMAALPALLVLPWIWRKPLRGVYLLMAGAVVFEQFPLHFTDSLTDRIPIFLNLDNSVGLSGFSVSPFEILMGAVLLIWLAKGVAEHDVPIPRGAVAKAYLIWIAVVAVGEVHGLFTGAKLTQTLWEIRPQIYGFVLFWLAGALIKERADLARLAGIFLVGVAIKGCLGAFRYLVTLHGSTAGLDSIMAHEESYFLGLFIAALLCGLIWFPPRRRLLWLMLAATVPVGIALLGNQRRAADLAMVAALGAVVVLGIRFNPVHRHKLVAVTALIAVVYGGLLVAFWNHASGRTAALVRPVKSLIQPDSRDYLSNLYRVAENHNILFTFHSSPVWGIGFGHPMFILYPMADISQIYPLWNYIPHNTVLWVGMRMGALGFIALWGLLGLAILQATREIASHEDGFLKAVAAFVVAAILAEIAVGWGDLQLDAYRNLVFLGAVIGVASALPRLRHA
ncbi:MAG: O-antigen ligase family protein [Candidatus Dormibacteraceae bacterium]